MSLECLWLGHLPTAERPRAKGAAPSKSHVLLQKCGATPMQLQLDAKQYAEQCGSDSRALAVPSISNIRAPPPQMKPFGLLMAQVKP